MSASPHPHGRPANGAPGPRAAVFRSRGLAALLALALVPVVLAAAGCGESKEEKAKKSACAARNDIKTRVTKLQSLSPTVGDLPTIKTEAEAIASDVKKIKEASQDLAPQRKSEIQSATEKFEKEAGTAIEKVGSSGSLSNVASELTTALHGLATAYASALEPVNCS